MAGALGVALDAGYESEYRTRQARSDSLKTMENTPSHVN